MGDRQYILLFSFADIKSEYDSRKLLFEILERIKIMIKTYVSFDAFFGISSRRDGFSYLNILYNETVSALKQIFFAMDAHPDDENVIVKNNIIINNYLHEIGEEYKGSIGIIAGYTEGTIISHNEICNVSYTGISVGWGWGYWDPDSDLRLTNIPPKHYPRFDQPTVARNNKMEYNHVHHVLQKLHDGGGIYTLSYQPGSRIQGNLIHDNGGFTGEGIKDELLLHNASTDAAVHEHILKMQGFPGGIYLDEASGGFEVVNNVVYDVAVPLFYHNVGIAGRFETNTFCNNYSGIRQGEEGFPLNLMMKAGLEEPYRYMLKHHEK